MAVSLFFGIDSVFGQVQDSIVVTTDKASYSEGEIILITGEVRDLYGIPVSIIVLSPSENTVAIFQVDVGADKKFSTEMMAGGALMKVEGTYTVSVKYGNENRTAETSFEFGGAMEETMMDETMEDTVEEEMMIEDHEPVPPRLSISIWSDKSSYTEGDIIKISGKITNPTSISKVSILVTGPDGHLVSIAQYSLNYDDTFSKTMTAGGGLIDKSGTYEFKVGYDDVSETGSFSYSASKTPPAPTPTYDTTPPKILKPTDITVDAENQNGAAVTFEVIAIDDTDQIVRPTCNPSSGAMFSIGTNRITCNAMDSSGNRAPSVTFSIIVNTLEITIPDWIKTVASVWCNDKIDNAEFIDAVQYLIDNHIITVSETSLGYDSSQAIPSWVKGNACWWSQDKITSEEFAYGIEYLIQQGIIRV